MIDWVHHDSVTTVNPPLPFEVDLKSVKKPQTNADRIRAMSDFELAEMLDLISCGMGPEEVKTAEDWQEWVKKEVDT